MVLHKYMMHTCYYIRTDAIQRFGHMCVCMYVCVYACMHACMYACNKCMYACTYVYCMLYVCMYAVLMYAHTHTASVIIRTYCYMITDAIQRFGRTIPHPAQLLSILVRARVNHSRWSQKLRQWPLADRILPIRQPGCRCCRWKRRRRRWYRVRHAAGMS